MKRTLTTITLMLLMIFTGCYDNDGGTGKYNNDNGATPSYSITCNEVICSYDKEHYTSVEQTKEIDQTIKCTWWHNTCINNETCKCECEYNDMCEYECENTCENNIHRSGHMIVFRRSQDNCWQEWYDRGYILANCDNIP